MSELQILTIDVINSLSGSDRYFALLKYHKWIKEKRKEERAFIDKRIRRINQFVYRKNRILTNKHLPQLPLRIHHRITLHPIGIFDNLLGWVNYD